MIRIAVANEDLLERIRATSPTWLKRAGVKQAKALEKGHVGEGDGIWSKIKEVFILLQEFKCIYCEFPLPKVDPASADKVAVDHDVEHFRPKNRVTPWPSKEALARRPAIEKYLSEVKAGSPEGYIRLAFDPFNYAVSCKVCNSSYKADHFPIAGHPDAGSTLRSDLDACERPLLLFPFGETTEDPADFLLFDGPLVRAKPALEPALLRARTLVDFFELDTRQGLLEGRCWMIQLLWPKLEARTSADEQERTRGEAFVAAVQQSHHLLHTACGRAFIELYEKDRGHAFGWYEASDRFLTSKDPAVLAALGAA